MAAPVCCDRLLRVRASAFAALVAVLLSQTAGCRRSPTPEAHPSPPAFADGGYDAATVTACGGAGYGPGPQLQAGGRSPSFVVLFNCLWPSHQRLEISVALLQPHKKRAEVEALLRRTWDGLESEMGKGFPETVKLCVSAKGSTISDLPLGCLRKGYEPEDEPGEAEEDLRIDMPPEPDELARSLGNVFGPFTGPRRPHLAFDLAKNEYNVVYPHADHVSGEWAPRPTAGSVLLAFFAVAWEFYPPKTATSVLRYEGVWRDKRLLRVHVPDLDAFLAMDPWSARQRLEAAMVPLALGAVRTSQQDAAVETELRRALDKLPAGSVVTDRPDR